MTKSAIVIGIVSKRARAIVFRTRFRSCSSYKPQAQGAIQFGNFGAVLNSDQGAETVSTSDLLQAMSLVQHELEEAEVRTHGHCEYARTVWQRTLGFFAT